MFMTHLLINLCKNNLHNRKLKKDRQNKRSKLN